jgi:crossover junction endodeoxyribonuclease RuvC
LGIDPGTLIMGYSVIEAYKNNFSIRTIDVLKLSAKKDHYERLQKIHQRITELVEEFAPDEFAIEAPFFGKNVQSMLKLGRAQGVAIAAAMTQNIPVTEYSPKKVKQSITGNGNADKQQVWKMLQKLTALPDKPKYYDATDALAVALCHYFGSRSVEKKAKAVANQPKVPKSIKSPWEKFIQENGHRVKA